ncbi:MAG: MBL fold metallo-hydrolase, partial [Candidatus Micrarchaeota archaeon]
MEIECLGGAGEVGRSGFLLRGNARVLVDYGIKIVGTAHYPKRIHEKLDGVVISHAHLDHSGFLPYIYEEQSVQCFGTAPTEALCNLLIEDSMKISKDTVPFGRNSFKRALRSWFPVPYKRRLEMKNWALEMHDAGHIPGSAMALIEMNGKRICYSGDFKLQDTELHKGAEPPENVDVLMIESTYANREHPDRKELEKKLKNEIWETLDDGGYVLFPCFAVGRSQEMVQLLNRFKIGEEIYLDGMAKAASDIILDFPSYVRDYDSLLRALKRVHWVRTPGMRKKVLSEPSVIVS